MTQTCTGGHQIAFCRDSNIMVMMWECLEQREGRGSLTTTSIPLISIPLLCMYNKSVINSHPDTLQSSHG